MGISTIFWHIVDKTVNWLNRKLQGTSRQMKISLHWRRIWRPPGVTLTVWDLNQMEDFKGRWIITPISEDVRVLGWVWEQQYCFVFFHVSLANFCIIASQHHSKPNISPRFPCQTRSTISDKNNEVLQSESQVSEHWINTWQQGFLSREDRAWGGKDIQSGFNVRKSPSVFPVQPSFVITVSLQRNCWPRSINGKNDTEQTFPDSCSLGPPCL